VDYAHLFQNAGVLLRKRNAGRAWAGELRARQDNPARIRDLQAPGTPAYEAGLEQDDQITDVDGKPVSSLQQVNEAIAAHKPGDTITVAYKRRSGAARSSKLLLAEDPSVEAVLMEDAGGSVTPAQKAFRDAWLGSRQKP
jgi:S1-C subfamily serine protease